MKKWFCYFDFFKKDPITVGDVLILLCDGTEPANFSGKHLRIELLPTGQEEPFDPYKKYSLYALENMKLEKNNIGLYVGIYRTGDFNHPFIITDGTEKVFVDNLSFRVESVLQKTKDGMKPEGPLGPFDFSSPLSWHPILIFVLLFLSWSALFIRGKWKRNQLINKIKNRLKEKKLKPSKIFFHSLRESEYLKKHSVQKLEQAFKLFLENLFFIPTKMFLGNWFLIPISKIYNQLIMQHQKLSVFNFDTSNIHKWWIMHNLKRFHNKLYQTEKKALGQLLDEFSAFNKNPRNKEEAYLRLKKSCQEMVLRLENKDKSGSPLLQTNGL